MSEKMNFSVNQERIFTFGREDTRSAIVIAVAGAGKTTTLVELFRRINDSVLMLAFNKSIADELKARVPEHVQCSTFHSIGFVAWQKFVGGRVQVDGNKVRGIMNDLLSTRDLTVYGSFVAKMVSYAKAAGVGFLMPDVEGTYLKLAEHFDCTPDVEGANIQKGIELARTVLKQSINEARQIVDFDDMLFMPLIENIAFPKFNFVCIDEAQDTNGVQRALLKRMLNQPHGRLIAVGDPKQAIYGFRGADSSAMEMIKDDFGCVELPLTVSYRCPQAVVAKAQEIVPYIEASEKAPVGLVAFNPGEVVDGKFIAQAFRPTDAILCRNVAPLISLAYVLLGKQIPCQILGRDIGKGLVDLVKKLNARGIDNLIEKLAEFERREVDKFMAKDQAAKAEAVKDKVACVNIFINILPETNRSVPALIATIERLFSDKDTGVLTLCTVHKSKGLEWERVYILDADKLMPSKWAKQEWQKEQEANLMYVAYTRAKLELYFVTSEHLAAAVVSGAVQKVTAPVQEEAPATASAEPRQPGEVRVGDFVEVVKGRNVPIGTKGTVVKCFGEPWFAIIIKFDGKTEKTYAKNVRVL